MGSLLDIKNLSAGDLGKGTSITHNKKQYFIQYIDDYYAITDNSKSVVINVPSLISVKNYIETGREPVSISHVSCKCCGKSTKIPEKKQIINYYEPLVYSGSGIAYTGVTSSAYYTTFVTFVSG